MQNVRLKAGDFYEQAIVAIHKFVSPFDLTQGKLRSVKHHLSSSSNIGHEESFVLTKRFRLMPSSTASCQLTISAFASTSLRFTIDY